MAFYVAKKVRFCIVTFVGINVVLNHVGSFRLRFWVHTPFVCLFFNNHNYKNYLCITYVVLPQFSYLLTDPFLTVHFPSERMLAMDPAKEGFSATINTVGGPILSRLTLPIRPQ